MNSQIKIRRICFLQLHCCMSTARVPVVLIILAFFIMENLAPVVDFSKMVNIHVTPYAFPHLVNEYRCQLIFMAGAVMLFCDAPFEGSIYPYILPRAGRSAWALGQITYIIILALFYVLFLFILSVFPFLGSIHFDTEWGKIWGTLAKTDAGLQIGLPFTVTEYLVSHYRPIPATGVSIILEWACVSLLGLLIYFLNKITKRQAGTVSGAFVVLLDICIANDWLPDAYRFSPITLAQINTYAGVNLQYHISFRYGIFFFATGILVLSGLCVIASLRS